MTYIPGSNTLVYLPFDEVNRYTNLGTGGIFETSGGYYMPTFTTKDGVSCIKFNKDVNSSAGIIQSKSLYIGRKYTVSFWINAKYVSGVTNIVYDSSSQPIGVSIISATEMNFTGVIRSSGASNEILLTDKFAENTWQYVTLVCDEGTYTAYLGGVLQNSYSLVSYSIDTVIRIGQIGGYLSDFIIDKTAWSNEDITKYYNQTKSKYGK